MELIADTTFLIGLWRRQSWAVSYAKANTHRTIGLPWIVLGEFWHGAVRAEHDPEVVERFLSIGLPLVDAESAVPAYAENLQRIADRRLLSRDWSERFMDRGGLSGV